MRSAASPGGVVSCRIDLTDYFAYCDAKLSTYNFLRFSGFTWRFIVSPLNFNNRLRRGDYLRMATEAGFQVVSEYSDEPTADDLRTLQKMRLASRFRSRPLEGLGVKYGRLVLRRDDVEIATRREAAAKNLREGEVVQCCAASGEGVAVQAEIAPRERRH